MIKLALVLALLPFAAQAAKKDKPMEWKGQNGGTVDAEERVIVDANGWTRLWLMIGQDAPPLDFVKYYAVAVFAGERPTGGYVVDFQEPVAKGKDTVVRYTVKTPTGFTTQALTQPWKVRAFPRVKGKVSIEAIKEITPK